MAGRTGSANHSWPRGRIDGVEDGGVTAGGRRAAGGSIRIVRTLAANFIG
jgi:hypothetical protein